MSKQSHRQICNACLEKEYETYAHARVHESMQRNDGWINGFMINDWPRWDYDHEVGRLIFSERGCAKVIADVVAVGTVNRRGTRWEWSWGNPNFPAHSRESMSIVRAFGEEKEWPKLTTLFLENDEYLGWELSAISAHILDAEGAYRCPDSDEPGNFIYLLAFNTRSVN